MQKPLLRFHTPVILLTLVGLFLLSCSPQIATETSELTLATIFPTETPEFIPTGPSGAREMVILSYEEDGYAHLFAYIPEKMPLTRLTNGTWDDISPAASPDGKKIAFASNRSGFW